MKSLNRKKSSKYVAYVGWALKFYCSNYNDILDLQNAYGKEKVQYEEIKKYL